MVSLASLEKVAQRASLGQVVSKVQRAIRECWALQVSRIHRIYSSLYPVSHPIEPRDFVMFSFMTCDCPLPLRVQLSAVFPKSLEARRDGNRGILGIREHDETFSSLCFTGHPGQSGPAGLKGEPGSPGQDGEPGPRGDLGPQGDWGDTGRRGPRGKMGKRGKPGTAGNSGFPGTPGADGAPGPQGPPGPSGIEGERIHSLNC